MSNTEPIAPYTCMMHEDTATGRRLLIIHEAQGNQGISLTNSIERVIAKIYEGSPEWKGTPIIQHSNDGTWDFVSLTEAGTPEWKYFYWEADSGPIDSMGIWGKFKREGRADD